MRRILIASAAIIATLLSAPVTMARSNQPHRLTFDDRVQAQRSIDRVLYSHQIGAAGPFETAVPREVLERKVRTYLKQSVALEYLWKTPVTALMFEREFERIAASTRLPERLTEIYEALNNDPLLIIECYVRPILVDRLAREAFARDGVLHVAARQEATVLREQIVSGGLPVTAVHPRRTTILLSRAHESGAGIAGKQISEHPDSIESPRILDLPDDEYIRFRSQAPSKVGVVGPVVEQRDALTFGVVLEEGTDSVEIATYTIPKMTWDAWWAEVKDHLDENSVRQTNPLDREVARGSHMAGATDALVASESKCGDSWENGSLDDLPIARVDHTGIWTGNVMVVWGGYSGGRLENTGGRYDPVADNWAPTSTIQAPAGRVEHTAVWTGSVMVVWGGGGSPNLNTGGRYDPVADTWLPTSVVGAPTGREAHSAVWTGSVMVVWGGDPAQNTGGRYDPVMDTWLPTSTIGAPTGREWHTAVWSGEVMVVWGGIAGPMLENSGGRYDPDTDTWLPTSTVGAPTARQSHSAVWTGLVMVVWGSGAWPDFNTGGRYDPVADTWLPTSTDAAPSLTTSHTAVWTGSVMVVWGGNRSNDGGRYDPLTDTWAATSTVGAPTGRDYHTAVWTGSTMVVWGGINSLSQYENTGGRYDPVQDTWVATSAAGGPVTGPGHTAVWTGNVMVVWGGSYGSAGGRYDPVADTWLPLSTIDAPDTRASHTAVWTGSVMIVWGGGGYENTGGRYDPIADTWLPTSTFGAPEGRTSHSAVWTGSVMVVWAGYNGTAPINTGGRYDPVSDTWAPTSLTGAPNARHSHTAIYTGSVMVVWGGAGDILGNEGGRYDPSTNTWLPMSSTGAPVLALGQPAVWTGSVMVVWGGRYNPITDTWLPISTVGAPTDRAFHTTVWTGSVMVVWGGGDWPQMNTGGRYDPVADTWLPTATDGAPAGRYGHTAVWTGSEMLIWGGYPLASGGRYVISSAGPFEDADDDGFSVCSGDCDDTDPMTWTGAPELCDNVDNDCDGTVDAQTTSCGAGACLAAGLCMAGIDSCQPGTSSVEVCDDLDNDCDGAVDDGMPDNDADGLCSLIDNCPSVYNPGQENSDGDAEGGDACDITVTFPLEGEVTCAAPPPTIEWSPEVYNRFRVIVSWLPTLPAGKSVTSGDTLLKTTSWTVPAKKWATLCSRANPVLYIKVLGKSITTGVKEYSEVVAVTVK